MLEKRMDVVVMVVAMIGPVVFLVAAIMLSQLVLFQLVL